MKIATKTIVTFLLPKEIDAVQKFEKEHDMAFWKQTGIGMNAIYTKTEICEIKDSCVRCWMDEVSE